MVKKRGNGIYEWGWAGGDGFVRKLKEVLGACLFEGIQRRRIEGGFLRPPYPL